MCVFNALLTHLSAQTAGDLTGSLKISPALFIVDHHPRWRVCRRCFDGMASFTSGGLFHERPERTLDERMRLCVFQVMDADAAIRTFDGERLRVTPLIVVGKTFGALAMRHFRHNLACHRATESLFKCYAPGYWVSLIKMFFKLVELPEQPGIACRLCAGLDATE